MFHIACVVEPGIGGHGNDDRALVCDYVVESGEYEHESDKVLAIVCDGVGGESFGNQAAQVIVEHFAKVYSKSFDANIIELEIETANCKIVNCQHQDREHSKMASTIAGLYLWEDNVIAFNVGDTKIYRYRAPYISQLSTDHSLVAELKELGLTSKPGQEHVITRCLGGDCSIPDINEGMGKSFMTDSYLICSDGITDVISELEIEEIMGMDKNEIDLCKLMVSLAIERGTQDNISVIVIRRH